MDDFDWKQRRAELEAAAPAKRKKTEPFVRVPLWWVEAAAKATRTPAALVLVYLLHASWKAKSTTFPLPNVYLNKNDVGTKVKRRVLRDLEAAGLISVERPSRKSPIVTLIIL